MRRRAHATRKALLSHCEPRRSARLTGGKDRRQFDEAYRPRFAIRKRTDAPARPQKGFRAYASPPCSRMATHPQEVPAHRTPPHNVGEKMAPTHRHTTQEEPTGACRRTRGHHCPLEPSARLRYPTRHTRSAHDNTKNEPQNGQGRNAPTRRRCANNRRLCAPERLVGPWARGVQGYENGRFAFHPSAPLEPPRMASPEEHAEPRLKFPSTDFHSRRKSQSSSRVLRNFTLPFRGQTVAMPRHKGSSATCRLAFVRTQASGEKGAHTSRALASQMPAKDGATHRHRHKNTF